MAMMSKTLSEVFHEAESLPEGEQEALAAWIRAELAEERRWARAFAQSPDALASLAAEALAEYKSGQTLPLEPDNL